MINQILLQISLVQEADATTTAIMVAGVFAFILLLIVGSIISNRRNPSKNAAKGATNITKPLNNRASRKKFKKATKNIGLLPIHIKILEDLAERYKIGSPLLFLTSPKVFNVTMKKAIQEYDSGAYSTEVKENYKMLLFAIKQKLDRSSVLEKKISTSRQLAIGKQITITTGSGERYTSNIVTNAKDYIFASAPTRHDGSMLRLVKWEPVKVSVMEKGDVGFFYDSKIAGHSKVKGTSCILLQHSTHISTSRQRHFPRKEFGKSCYFFKITVITLLEGKTEVKKAVMDDASKGRLGSVLEISAGGCSIKSANYLTKGDLLKVDIDIERRKTVSILGKIVNLRRIALGTAIMHIQFTKMSKKNMNSINSYIYGIEEKTSILDY